MADINGNGQDNFLTGTLESDVIRARGGNDTANGAEGDDSILGNAGNDSLLGGFGSDTLKGGNDNDTLDGGEGSDSLYGGNDNDDIYGGLGDDYLNGGKGTDLMDGGEGNDSAWGGDGDDTMFGGAGSDTLKGGNDNDLLDGGADDDLILGGNGDDTLVASAGNDTLNGNSGVDTALFSGTRSDYSVSQVNGTTVLITGPGGDETRVQNVEIFQFADVVQTFAEVIQPWTPPVNLEALSAGVNASTVAAGDFLGVTWSIASNGADDAATSTTEMVIASAPDLGSVLQTVATVETGPIAAGSAVGFQRFIDTSGLAPGTYYLAAIADSEGALAESDETDNVTDWVEVVIEAPKPNLSINAITLTGPIVTGDSMTVEWQIASDGAADAVSSDTQVVIASAPDLGLVIDNFGFQSTGALPTAGITAYSGALDTTGFAPGTYWIGAIADLGDVLAESNESDNILWAELTIDPAPNLTAEITSVLMTGALLDVDWTLSEVTGSAFGQSIGELVISFTPDQGGIFQSFDLAPFGPGSGGGTDTFKTTSDLSGLTPGTYWIAAVADSGGQVTESDETDNFSTWVEITVPDPNAPQLFVGTAASESFIGGGGNDTLTGLAQSDYFDGADGFDLIDLSQESGGVQILFTELPPIGVEPPWPLQIVSTGDPFSTEGEITNVEAVIGTAFDDVILATNSSLVDINGGDGNDTLQGSEGNDIVRGGAGDDVVTGFFGDDLLETGDGFDFVVVERQNSGSTTSGLGTDVVSDFDISMDAVVLSYSASQNPGLDPLLLFTQTVDGARFDYAQDSSLLLQGVDVADLTANHILLDDTDIGFASV